MKRKFASILMFMAVFCVSYLINIPEVRAEETGLEEESYIETNGILPINSIAITQYPSKTVYNQGESLDLWDMVVEGYFSDGTSVVITDYVITGYDSNLVGPQTVIISYQDQYTFLNVTVNPKSIKVSNISVTGYSTSSISLLWDLVPTAVRYEIYNYDNITGSYILAGTSLTNNITINYPAGSIVKFYIYAIENIGGVEYKSEISDEFVAATAPEGVTGLKVTNTTPKSVALTWDITNGATGYMIYRAAAGSSKFSYVGTVVTNSYIEEGLSSGVGYRYRVCAYTYDPAYFGKNSSIIDTSTNPAKAALKFKAGEGKIRFTYTKVTGATYYDIYVGDSSTGFTLLTSRKAGVTNTFVSDGFLLDSTYTFYTVVRREYKGVVYESPASDNISVTIKELLPTNTEGKFFLNEWDFVKSWAFKYIGFFQRNVDYSRSYVIPGLKTTNVGGFSSTNMCPQAITFAGDYLLQTAYDMAGEENSVIYVMDKKTKNLLTTLVLATNTHAGGISYDGKNIWISRGTSVASIPFSEVKAAVATGAPYVHVKYHTTISLGVTASFITYYKSKLWVGTYNELKSTYMYSYTIGNKNTTPTLKKVDTIAIPTRVQGAAFTTKGTLILSRSCQQYKGLRGYMRQIDLYKPDLTKTVNGVIQLGDPTNTVAMPTMNEGIAIDGSYIYVTFESGAFKKSSFKMDRICAFKLSSLNQKTGK